MKLFSLLDIQYNNFLNNVRNYLSKTLSNFSQQFGSNTIFGQIITVVGNAMQNIMLYIEDALVEQNKYTAQRKKSIYGLAALSGYMPCYGKAAMVSIKLNFVPSNIDENYKVIIKDKEVLTCNQNGLPYNIILPQEAIILDSMYATTKYFTAVQGKFESQRFISTGGKYYTINFKFAGNLDVDYITVKVNNEIWEKTESLYDMTPMSKQYTYKASVNGGIDVLFGNEVHGKPLRPNDVVEITYLIHDGENGNLDPEVETYFIFNDQLTDIAGENYDGNNIFMVTFAETDPVSAGSNSETLQHVREMIGLNSRSLVLASPDNYKYIISKFGFCGYNRTWSDPNSMTVNSLIMKNFRTNIKSGLDYFNLNESDFYLTANQKDSIYTHIKNTGNQLASIKYNIVDPELCKYAIYIYLKLTSGKYNRDLIKTKIRTKIGEFFSDVKSDMYIPKSDIIHLLKSSIEGIDSVDVYIISQKNEEAIYKGQYTEEKYVLNNTTGQYIKVTENIKLYSGENPNIGLDGHGNILLQSNHQFPVLMGNWSYYNSSNNKIQIIDPLTIIFED